MTEQETKYLKIGGGILLASVLLYFLLSKNPDSGASEDPTQNSGIPFDPKMIASNLLLYMDKWGTDEEEIIAELSNINQTQFGQVFTAFGKKNYNSWTGGDDYGGSLQNLKYWLREELSDFYYDSLKLKYPNFL